MMYIHEGTEHSKRASRGNFPGLAKLYNKTNKSAYILNDNNNMRETESERERERRSELASSLHKSCVNIERRRVRLYVCRVYNIKAERDLFCKRLERTQRQTETKRDGTRDSLSLRIFILLSRALYIHGEK